MAIVGARLYYCIFEWDYYGQRPLEIITGIRDGGLAIYGGIIASVITLFIFTRVRKLSFFRMADTACLGLVAGQIIGRWGNFFNREAFGGYTDYIFAMQIPVKEANGVTRYLLLNAYTYNGEAFIQVHPTFLYEGAWNLMVLIGLLLYKKHKKFDGELIALYFFAYGMGRAWIEGLRTDQLILQGTDIPVSQMLSVVLMAASAIFITINRMRIRNGKQAAVMNGDTMSDGTVQEDVSQTAEKHSKMIEEVILGTEEVSEESDDVSEDAAKNVL